MTSQAVDAVVTHHEDTFRSGVARFNELLAAELGVPLVPLAAAAASRVPLLSFKFDELDAKGRQLFDALTQPGATFELFLHSYSGHDPEERAVRHARRVWCGNHEIAAAVAALTSALETVWTPGLISDRRDLNRGELTVFSFGMAHKIQIGKFRRLRDLLEATGRTFAVYVSTANHETASMRDAQAVFEEMHELFPDELYFMGNLSDVLISNYLRSTSYFASFFPRGVRANNTSIASAMEHGAVVITNLDEFSPDHLRHEDNILDVGQCETLPTDARQLAQIGDRATESSRGRGWETLTDRINRPASPVGLG